MFSSARRSRCFLFQTQNHSSVRVTTSRKQERTKEERSVLLYNNRWICLLPFARKPDPRRVSKQVSREPPQAWLFGLVRFGAAGRTKSAAGRTKAPQASQFSAPQAGKITRPAAICSSRSVFARAAPAEQHRRGPLVVHKQRRGPPRGASFAEALCCFFFFSAKPALRA